MKVPCQFAVIQFMPYPETGEFANVGVVVLCHEKGYFGFKLLKRYGRITRFFESMDRRIYLEGKRVIHDELVRFKSLLKGNELDLRRKGRSAENALRYFSELTRAREALFRFDEPSVALVDDPRQACEEFFGYFVERDFVTKEYEERQLERAVRRILAAANLGDIFEEGVVGDDTYHVRFPFIARGGRSTSVIKPLFLAQDEPSKIYAHADVWIPKVKRLRDRNHLPERVLFPLTGPEDTDQGKRLEAFREVKTELESVGVHTVNAAERNEIITFAEASVN